MKIQCCRDCNADVSKCGYSYSCYPVGSTKDSFELCLNCFHLFKRSDEIQKHVCILLARDDLNEEV